MKHMLDTKRLKILPLQADKLALAINNYESLQSELGLRVVDSVLDEEMQYAMKVRLKKVLEDTENYMWLTNWAIILKQSKELIGFIMLKGYPNKFGEVIVGYGINERYRKNGYASEALKAMVKWIFKNNAELFVVADTEKSNEASHKVLQNAGAVKYKEEDALVWWRIENRSDLNV